MTWIRSYARSARRAKARSRWSSSPRRSRARASPLPKTKGWHGKPLSKDQAREVIEKTGRAGANRRRLGAQAPEPVPTGRVAVRSPRDPETALSLGEKVATRKAAGTRWPAWATATPRSSCSTATSANSTYTEIFGKKFPDRFIECYIAERNMSAVSLGLRPWERRRFLRLSALLQPRARSDPHGGDLACEYQDDRHARRRQHRRGRSIADGARGPGLGARGRRQPHVAIPAMRSAPRGCVELMAAQAGIFYLRASRPETPVIYARTSPSKSAAPRSSRNRTGRAYGRRRGVTVFEALEARELLGRGRPALHAHRRLQHQTAGPRADPRGSSRHRNRCSSSRSRTTTAEGGLGDAVRASSARGRRVHKLAVRELPHQARARSCSRRYGIDAQAIVEKVQGSGAGREVGSSLAGAELVAGQALTPRPAATPPARSDPRAS